MDPSPDPIDGLLERYLALLDEYTSLRAELSRLQSSTFQHLARANFAAERGVRYGADFYDERMRAGRTVVVDGTGAGAEFRVVTDGDEKAAEGAGAGAENTLHKAEGAGDAAGDEKAAEQDGEGDGEIKTKKKVPADPIRWFGVLTPLALRQAQSCAVDAIERVVPRLVTVDMVMLEVEIEVRRARKRRAKAEAAAAKDVGREQAPLVREEAAVS